MRWLAVAFLFLSPSPVFAASPLVMPVTGEWIALDGPPCADRRDGDCASASTRYGFELAPLDPFGRPAETCLNQPVRSPSDGVVVAVLDSFPNFAEAGQHRFGNHIVIQRGEHEFIVLGSLMHRSLKVGLGDRVAAGEIVARCGFSGASGRPALHVHIQAGRDILDPDSAGLAMPFADLSVRTPGGCQPTSLLYRGQGTC
jgi:hypothetical protein